MDFLVLVLLFCLLLPLLWYKSHIFRFYVRWIYYVSVVTIFTGTIITPVLLLRPKDVRNLSAIFSVWRRMFSIIGIRYEARGKENIESDKPCVIVCNHQSSIDVIAMMNCWPSRCTAMAKKSLMYAGTFGMAAWLSGLVFIDRVNREKARETMQETAEYIHKNNIKIWIFPEGTRNKKQELLPFKKGAFHLAVQGQIPIVPVVISNYENFYIKRKKIFEPGKVIIQCLPPVSTEGLTTDDVSKLTEQVRDQMVAVFPKISKEVLDTSPPIESLL